MHIDLAPDSMDGKSRTVHGIEWELKLKLKNTGSAARLISAEVRAGRPEQGFSNS
jgi:hypothetical protein